MVDLQSEYNLMITSLLHEVCIRLNEAKIKNML
jgi:hypothetical protein